jgi:hypothetical protein
VISARHFSRDDLVGVLLYADVPARAGATDYA